jgi:hypothetical protein
MSEDTESRTGYIIGALINAAMLVVVHKLPDWNVKVITEEWTNVLYPVTIALVVQVAGNAFLAWRSSPFRHRLFHVLFDFTSIAALWRIVRVFPFDFAPLGFDAGNTIFRVLLYLALFGVFVGMVSNLIRLFGFLIAEKAEKQEQQAQEEQNGSFESGSGAPNTTGATGRRSFEDPYAEDEEHDREEGN